MKHFYSRLAAGVLLAAILLSACDGTGALQEDLDEAPVARNGELIPGQYIVVLKDQSQFAGKTARRVLDEMTSAVGVEAIHHYETALVGFAGSLSDEALARLQHDPRVDYIEQDRVITLPPISTEGLCDKNPTHPKCQGGGGGEDPPSEVTPWGITRVGGGATSTGTAWVIDTGVDQDHPDLNVDTGRSKSFLTGKEKDNPDDQHGHGTHVAGTIAAIDNDRDVVGVAAGATVVSVRVLDRRGSGTTSGVIAGVDYVGATGAAGDVANMSLGGGASQALDDAVINASSVVKFALAAGNSGADANNYSPARANGVNISTVSAFDDQDVWASFSNYGNPPIDWAAPGVAVASLWKNGGTKTISGTSMAAPHVAGLLLLGDIPAGGDGTVNGDPDGTPDKIAHK